MSGSLVSPHRGRSQRGHVVEGMVELLTDGFVLQLLSVELVCQARGQQEQASKKCREERPQEESREAKGNSSPSSWRGKQKKKTEA